jgi:hypothetical protein
MGEETTMDLRGKLRLQIDSIKSCTKHVDKAIALAKAISEFKAQENQEENKSLQQAKEDSYRFSRRGLRGSLNVPGHGRFKENRISYVSVTPFLSILY